MIDRYLTGRAFILFAMMLAIVWGFWQAPLYDIDEGAFTEATREMVSSGNYASIYLNGDFRSDKPILIYWVQALSVKLFGINEAAFRLPSVVAGCLWVFVLFRFAKRYTDVETAKVAVLIMALSLFVGLISKAAVADALLNLFIALAMFDIYRYAQQADRKLLYRVFTWLGLGFLTKGPVAVAIPFISSLLYFASYGRWRDWLGAVANPVGIGIFLLIVVPWHVAVYLDSGWTFFEGFYLHHNLDRYQSPMEGHSGGLLYYLVVAPLIIMPFGGWMLWQASRLRSALSDPLERLIWLWFLTVLAVFSFSGTKLPHYLLYGLTGMFLLMAKHRQAVRSAWLVLTPPMLLLAVITFLPQIFSILAEHAQRVYEQTLFAQGATQFSGWPQYTLLCLLICGLLLAGLRLPLWQRAVSLGVIQTLAVAVIVVPLVLDTLQAGPKAAALFAREQGKQLVLYGKRQPSISVYSQQVIPRRAAIAGDWVYVRSDQLEDFLATVSAYSTEIVFRQPPAVLVAVNEPRLGSTP